MAGSLAALEFDSSSTNQTSYTTGSVSVVVGRLLTAQVESDKSGAGFPNTPSISNSGTALTWTVEENTQVGSGDRFTVWTAPALTTESITITFDWSGQTQAEACWGICEGSGLDPSGTVVQTNLATGSNDAPAGTLAAFGDDVNNLVFVAIGGAGSPGFTPESPYVELGRSAESDMTEAAWDTGEDLTPSGSLSAATDWAFVSIELKAAVVGTNNGSSAVTLGAAVQAATGEVLVQGSSAVTMGNHTGAGTGSTKNFGTLAVTLEAAIQAATGEILVQGTLAQTLEDCISAATGEILVQGTSAPALEDYVCAAEGSTLNLVDGSSAVTLENAILAATGKILVEGISAVTLANAISAGAGEVLVQGSLAQTLEDHTCIANGTVGVAANNGTLATTLENAVVTAIGTILVSGISAPTLENAICVATGKILVQGSSAVTLADFSGLALGGDIVAGLLDAKRAKLILAGFTGHAEDQERDWLISLVAVPNGLTLRDLWYQYLIEQLVTPGNLNDMMMEWLNGLGYTTGSLNDRWTEYWNAP